MAGRVLIFDVITVGMKVCPGEGKRAMRKILRTLVDKPPFTGHCVSGG